MGPRDILVVDDEPDICPYLALLFQEHGYSVRCASNGHEAAARVKEARPDLIMLDISIPDKSGLKFYREMKSTAELSRIPVVVVAAARPRSGSRHGEHFGTAGHPIPPPDGVIAKPINVPEMIELVNRLVAGRQTPQPT